MHSWEYKLVSLVIEKLNEAGSEHWEAVGITVNPTSSVPYVLMKRKVGEE
jgi:hypothetical protein